MKIITTNRKAFRDYNIVESVECGIELKGGEVKSIREGNITLNEGFARLEEGGILLYNIHINPYAQASYMNVDPDRPRRLLLHKGQIRKLEEKISQKGSTLVPIKAYFNDRGFVKIEIALCKGKKLYDKRQDLKRREIDLSLRRVVKDRSKGR